MDYTVQLEVISGLLQRAVELLEWFQVAVQVVRLFAQLALTIWIGVLIVKFILYLFRG